MYIINILCIFFNVVGKNGYLRRIGGEYNKINMGEKR